VQPSRRRTPTRQGHAELVTGHGGRTLAGNFIWTVDDMLVAIGVLELGKQTLGRGKGRRTERECDWHDWVRAGNRRREERWVVSWQSHEGVVDSERGGWSVRTENLKPQRSTFALNFGRRLVLGFGCMFQLVDNRNHDEVGDS